MADLWAVLIGDPPYAFGPFGSERDALDFVAEYGGTAWPLWKPENAAAHVQSKQTLGTYRG